LRVVDLERERGVMSSSMGDARPSMARQSLAVLLAVTRASSVCVWASTLPVWLRVWARRVCG